MKTTQVQECTNCTKPLPSVGFFCGGCLTQFKCKSCEALLEKDTIGCIFCGTPKDQQAIKNGKATIYNVNTFSYHEIITEKSTERTIEGAYSDNVSKDFSSVLINKLNLDSTITNNNIKISAKSENDIAKNENFQDAEIIRDEKNSEAQSINIISSNEYPALKAVAMKNLPASETEWIVTYAFYASDYGVKIFSHDDIINKYRESSRFNKDTTKKYLSTHLKRAVQQGFINPLNVDYSILDEGIKKAKEIISRTSSSSPKATRKATKSKSQEDQTNEGKDKKERKSLSKSGKSAKRLTDINFHPSSKDSLDKFCKEFSIKNDSERNLLFVYYLSETLKISAINNDHIYTCYDELDLRIPENIQSSINNTKTRTGWIETDNNSNIVVTVKGRNKKKLWNKKD